MGGFQQGLDDIQTGSWTGAKNVPSTLWNAATTATFSPFSTVRTDSEGLPELFIPNPLLAKGYEYKNERQARWGLQVTAGIIAAPGVFAAPFAGASRLSILAESGTVSTRAASSTAFAETGSYLHTFESGKFYAGKGPISRMNQTGRFFSQKYSDPLVSSEF